ncbi:EthD family reductase [Gordonia zhaorongruii]|uniref:EthD family reductase n=1 Tax=Gordonia zhaorongruii TaxID=2597659 RepID=UPI0010496DC4|nr:EthD family reductase [Gordonia zhaorongruii]
MFRITVNYNHPEDPEQFLEHYRTVHAPLTVSMPGITSFEWGVCETLDGSTPEHFVVGVVTFPSRDAAIAGLGSPEGEAGRNDMANFAGAGVVIDMHEVTTA